MVSIICVVAQWVGFAVMVLATFMLLALIIQLCWEWSNRKYTQNKIFRQCVIRYMREKEEEVM